MTYLLRLVACLLIISAAFFSVMSWAVIPEQKVLSSDGAERDRFGYERLYRRRYGCHWCSWETLTQARPMCMCAVMACGVSKRS